MRRSEVGVPWCGSAYTGLFRDWGPVPRRAHDPEVHIWAGSLASWAAEGDDLAVGGAGWDANAAEAAGVGEAIERWQCRPLPCDQRIYVSRAKWSREEPLIEPERWVLFHPQQYDAKGFPFQPCTHETAINWVCCREAGSGCPVWVPEEFVFLMLAAGEKHQLGPAISTGLSCGRLGDPVLLRGLQEVIERDGLMGAWWRAYHLEEHDAERVFSLLPRGSPEHLRRPNLRYRCYRVDSPYSSHVTIVTLEGEDHEGFCFSVGSACRESRSASWQKSFLEAVQGRHFVRHLKAKGEQHLDRERPIDFAGHALFYTLYPEKLRETELNRAFAAHDFTMEMVHENGDALQERLGAAHPVLFRQVTPPGLAQEGLDWIVLRVLVPGLQPMHGHHGYPFLGGPFWAKRDLSDWRSMLPHPFP
jgi:thiazole/oxazole-forming peptide maturase SagD family component